MLKSRKALLSAVARRPKADEATSKIIKQPSPVKKREDEHV